MTTHLTQQEILALLDWYQAAGVDTATGGQPLDWLARGPVPPADGFLWPNRQSSGASATAPEAPDPAASRPPPTSSAHAPPVAAAKIGLARPRPQTPLAASEAETEARRIARAAPTLDALEAALRAFDGCSLKATAKNLCFYRGSPSARIAIVGEAPGRDEDLAGKPFVGRAGQLLDKMLAAIGLTEADVHITNIVYWRPPGNRTPTPQESLACRPFLERQLELVNPDMIVALGGAAAKELFGVSEGIMRLRGKWRTFTIADRTVDAIATLHPAYLLRTPAAKQLAWHDFLQIKARLSN